VARYAKRIFAAGVTSILLTVAAAGTAAADPGNGRGQCLGVPPGQFVASYVTAFGGPPPFPPGEEESACVHGGF
jgi:hypothetical protein